MAVTLIAQGEGAYSGATGGTPTSHTFSKPSAAVEGTFVLVRFFLAIPGNAVSGPFTSAPTGFTELAAEWRTSGSLSGRYAAYYKVMTASESSTWTWTYSDPANSISLYEVYSGVDPTTPVVEGDSFVASTGATTRITPQITTAAERYITYDMGDRSASNPTAPSPDTATKFRVFRSSDSTIVSAYAGTQPAGTYQKTFTGAVNTSNYTTAIYALNPAPEGPLPLPGLPVTIWNGTTEDLAYMTIWNGTTEDEVTAVEVVAEPDLEGFVISDLLADDPFYVAHRGGSQAWPEMTMYAYAQAVAEGYKALEVSVYKCSTGEWVCSHDWTTERVTGIRYEIWDTPWSTLSTLEALPPSQNPSQPSRPLAELTEVLDAYMLSHVLFIESKETADTVAMLDFLDAYHPSVKNHVVIKSFKAGWAQAEEARSRGYTTWGCYFTNEALEAPDRISSFDWVGIEYNSTSTQRGPLIASGKPIIAHTPNSSTQVDAGLAWGADGMMSSRPDLIGP